MADGMKQATQLIMTITGHLKASESGNDNCTSVSGSILSLTSSPICTSRPRLQECNRMLSVRTLHVLLHAPRAAVCHRPSLQSLASVIVGEIDNCSAEVECPNDYFVFGRLGDRGMIHG